MRISEIMKRDIIIIQDDETIGAALEKMSNMRVNGAPVVNQMGKLVGMIVKADIYRFLMTPGHYEECPVEWVMSKEVITARVDEDVLMVGRRLRSNHIIAMPVIDEDSVVGIISIEDILDFFINT